MAIEKYILTGVSAGSTIDEETRKPIVWASVEVMNPRAKSTGRDGNVNYGSPRVKLRLIDEETGLPNIPLAQRLEKAGLYGQIVEFEGALDIVKSKGEESVSFVIFDANLTYAAAPASPASAATPATQTK